MAQVSSSKKKKKPKFSFYHSHKTSNYYYWLFWFVLGSFLLFWHWQLILSTGIGVIIMFLVYQSRPLQWLPYCYKWLQELTKPNQRLILAIISGAIASVSIYMIIAIWIYLQNSWIATGIILQGIATITTLGLLIANLTKQKKESTQSYINYLISELTKPEPLKRLIAVRQLTRYLNSQKIDPEQQQLVTDYFRIMITQETSTQVQDAIADALSIDNTDHNPLLKLGDPLNLKSLEHIPSYHL